MMKILLMVGALIFSAAPGFAQQVCDKTAPVQVPVGTTATVIGTTSGLSSGAVICGFSITGDTAGTRITFNNIVMASGGSSTPAFVVPVSGNVTFGNGVGQIMQGVAGSAVTVTCGTGSCTGIVSFR